MLRGTPSLAAALALIGGLAGAVAAPAPALADPGPCLFACWTRPRTEPPADPIRQALAAAIAQPDDARADSEAVSEQTRKAIRNGTVVPAADTVFLRHRSITPALEAAAVRRFQAVALAQSAALGLEILAPLRAHADPLTRYRAHLEAARLQFRTVGGRPTPAADEALARALREPLPSPRLRADAMFLTGYAAVRRRAPERAVEAFRQALEADPAYQNAARWAIAAKAMWLDQEIGRTLGATHCQAALEDLLATVRHLGSLVRNANHFRDMARDLRTLPALNGQAGQFVKGYLALLAADRGAARAAFAQVGEGRSTLSVPCTRVLAAHAGMAMRDLAAEEERRP